MTYRTLLTRIRNGVAVLASGTADGGPIDYDGAETTRIRYAVKKNRDRLQPEVEHFQELLKEKAEDLGEDAEVLQVVANDLLQGTPAGEVVMEDEPLDEEGGGRGAGGARHRDRLRALHGTGGGDDGGAWRADRRPRPHGLDGAGGIALTLIPH